MKKKGISLIVLVITIVVIIILAAAVILSLGNNNPIETAKEAKVKTTIDNFKSDLLMSVSKITADSLGQIDVTEIDAPGEKYQVVDLIPSIKGSEYENELIVVDGKIKLKEETTLPEETQNIIKEVLGEKVEGGNTTTPEEPTEPETPTIETYNITYNLDGGTATNPTEYTVETDTITLTNPTKAGYGFIGWTGTDITEPQITVQIQKGSTGNKEYTANWLLIGATVEYSGYSESTNNITWRIFNVTDSGVIQLIANDYVDLTYKGTAPATGINVNGYALYSSTDRATLINYLTAQSNWSEYAVSGKTTAVGVPTIEEFCSSYKLKYPDNYVVVKEVKAGDKYNGSHTASADGYAVKLSTEADTAYNYDKSIGTNDDLYIKTGTSYGSNTIRGAWLGSASSYSAYTVMNLKSDGNVDDINCGNVGRGVRPLVSLTSNVKIVDVDGVLKVQ